MKCGGINQMGMKGAYPRKRSTVKKRKNLQKKVRRNLHTATSRGR